MTRPITTAPADTARAMHAAYFGKDETMDIYTNEKPFGLMSGELKAAMLAHVEAGGRIKMFKQTGWDSCSPMWWSHFTYRAVRPALTPDVIAWDRLPDWVQSVARDADSAVFGYSSPYPNMAAYGWWHQGLKSARIDDFPDLVQIGTCDWKDSLQLRPVLK